MFYIFSFQMETKRGCFQNTCLFLDCSVFTHSTHHCHLKRRKFCAFTQKCCLKNALVSKSMPLSLHTWVQFVFTSNQVPESHIFIIEFHIRMLYFDSGTRHYCWKSYLRGQDDIVWICSMWWVGMCCYILCRSMSLDNCNFNAMMTMPLLCWGKNNF